MGFYDLMILCFMISMVFYDFMIEITCLAEQLAPPAQAPRVAAGQPIPQQPRSHLPPRQSACWAAPQWLCPGQTDWLQGAL